MKKILLLLLLISGIAEAQVVNIPDANFKAKLLQSNTLNTIAKDAAGNNIKIDINNDGQIQLSEALSVYQLEVYRSSIVDATGLQSFANLTKFDCQSNQLTSLNLSGLNNLTSLNCYNNRLTTINLASLSNLSVLFCGNNLLTVLDLSNHLQLTSLSCNNNQLTSLNLLGCVNLTSLQCWQNQLTALDLSNLVLLRTLSASANQFTNIDVSNLSRLEYIYLDNNNLTTFDATNLPVLYSLYLANNQLTELFIKNGSNEFSGETEFRNNPNLRYICADEAELEVLLSQLPVMGLTNVNVNSYCSFTPGGNYNTITGKTIFDSNNNGCDFLDTAQPFLKVKINDGTNQGATFTNTTGDYSFFTHAGNFTVTPEVENPTFFNINPVVATVNFPLVNNSVSTNNFCITANGNHPDAEIVIAPVTPARPGFDAVYKIVYKNRGNQMLSGNVYFYYNEALLDYVASSATPSQSNGLLIYAFSNLRPFESRSILVTLNVNSPTETPAVNIGDELIFNAVTDPLAGNEIFFTHTQTVVGSYDPNDITCLEGDVVPPSEIGKYLHYMIRFENTGNFSAENVVVKDIIDPSKYDISSLQILNSSHPVNADVKGNIAEFVFRNIHLDSGGHGNILIKLKSHSSLGSGSTVSNGVGIYFDYNFPVNTNYANTVFQALSIGDKNLDNSVKIYPNPAYDFVSIKASSVINSIEIYDVQGRILMTSLNSETSVTLDLSRHSSGIYYLKIKTDEGSKVEKVIKK